LVSSRAQPEVEGAAEAAVVRAAEGTVDPKECLKLGRR
jgi:hypothetical protein